MRTVSQSNKSVNKKIKASPAIETSKEISTENAGSALVKDILTENANDVKGKYSLSEEKDIRYLIEDESPSIKNSTVKSDYYEQQNELDEELKNKEISSEKYGKASFELQNEAVKKYSAILQVPPALRVQNSLCLRKQKNTAMQCFFYGLRCSDF